MSQQLSPDGKYFWNGSQWQPVAAPKTSNAWKVWLVIFAIGGVIAYFGSGSHSSTPPTISNAKIDSAHQVEFDYYAATDCNDLTFEYAFYDDGGNRVDDFVGSTHNTVRQGQSYHFTSTDFTIGESIASAATRFDVYASCHT
jgi:hypothetical protein